MSWSTVGWSHAWEGHHGSKSMWYKKLPRGMQEAEQQRETEPEMAFEGPPPAGLHFV